MIVAIVSVLLVLASIEPAFIPSEDQIAYEINRMTSKLGAVTDFLLNGFGADITGGNSSTMKIVLPPGTNESMLEEMLTKHDTKFKKIALRLRPNAFFEDFRRADQIKEFLDDIVRSRPLDTELLSLGKTHEGRDIHMLRISTNLKPKPKVVFIQAGLHAREWAAPSTLCFFIKSLVDNLAGLTRTLRDVELQLVPLANPDGYEYTHTTDRLWHNNRQPQAATDCIGIDLNHNYDIQFQDEEHPHQLPCPPNPAGVEPFSANETLLLSGHLRSLHGRLRAFVDLHASGQLLFYPFGYERNTYYNLHAHRTVAQSMADTIERVNGTKYEIGTAANLMYGNGGRADDWAAAELGVPLAFTVQLPGKDFMLPAEQIRSVGAETTAGLLQLVRVVHDMVE